MTETNGNIKINPVFAWTIATYLLALGAGVGVTLAKVAALEHTIASDMVVSRHEFEAYARGLDRRVFLLEGEIHGVGRTP